MGLPTLAAAGNFSRTFALMSYGSRSGSFSSSVQTPPGFAAQRKGVAVRA